MAGDCLVLHALWRKKCSYLGDDPRLVQLVAEIDAAGTAVFSIEYALRLWSASERPEVCFLWAINIRS
eukprot:3888767-Amphidinium_carterae.1